MMNKNIDHKSGMFFKHVQEHKERFLFAKISNGPEILHVMVHKNCHHLLDDNELLQTAIEMIYFQVFYYLENNAPLNAEVSGLPFDDAIISAYANGAGEICAFICPQSWAAEHFPFLTTDENDAA